MDFEKEFTEAYDISNAFEEIEKELVDSMMRNINRHRVEEIDTGLNWSMWQAEQLQALNEYKLKNYKKFTKEFKEINNKIIDLIFKARKTGNMKQEEALLKARLKGLFIKEKNDTLTSAFFKTNDRKLDALVKATKNDLEKAEYAMLRKADDEYRKIIYNAQVCANAGAGTYKSAVDMATKAFLSRGIQCIKYKNGAMHNIKDYADMAIRTATKRAYFVGEGEIRNKWGIHLVIMNKRGAGANNSGSGVCPKCQVWAGKILIDDVWSGGSKADGNYKLMSEAIELGLYHPRCKDSHTTYFKYDFDTEYDKEKYTSTEEKENIQRYNAEQKHNNAVRQIEKYKRLEEYALAKENREKYRLKKERWERVEKGLKN